MHYFSAPVLSEAENEIRHIGHFLQKERIDALYSSPFLRCRQTSSIIGEITKVSTTVDTRIRGYFFEPPWILKKRTEDFLLSLERSEFQRIGICSHGVVIARLLTLLLQKPLRIPDLLHQMSPGKVAVYKDGLLEVKDFRRQK